MIFLHGFWGVGAISAPIIFTLFKTLDFSWNVIVLFVSFIQFSLMVYLIYNKKRWKKTEERKDRENIVKRRCSKKEFVIRVLIIFIFSGFDICVNLWFFKYLESWFGFSPQLCGVIMTFYYISVTASRFVIGFFIDKKNLNTTIFISIISTLTGIIIVMLFKNVFIIIIGTIILGCGMCTIYPFFLFENHILYYNQEAKFIIKYQVAFNLIGSLIFSLLMGIFITYFPIRIYIFIQLFFIVIVLIFRMLLQKNEENLVIFNYEKGKK